MNTSRRRQPTTEESAAPAESAGGVEKRRAAVAAIQKVDKVKNLEASWEEASGEGEYEDEEEFNEVEDDPGDDSDYGESGRAGQQAGGHSNGHKEDKGKQAATAIKDETRASPADADGAHKGEYAASDGAAPGQQRLEKGAPTSIERSLVPRQIVRSNTSTRCVWTSPGGKQGIYYLDAAKKLRCGMANCERIYGGYAPLQYHMLSVHLQERPYPCSQDCGESFFTKQLRAVHEQKKHQIGDGGVRPNRDRLDPNGHESHHQTTGFPARYQRTPGQDKGRFFVGMPGGGQFTGPDPPLGEKTTSIQSVSMANQRWDTSQREPDRARYPVPVGMYHFPSMPSATGLPPAMAYPPPPAAVNSSAFRPLEQVRYGPPVSQPYQQPPPMKYSYWQAPLGMEAPSMGALPTPPMAQLRDAVSAAAAAPPLPQQQQASATVGWPRLDEQIMAMRHGSLMPPMPPMPGMAPMPNGSMMPAAPMPRVMMQPMGVPQASASREDDMRLRGALWPPAAPTNYPFYIPDHASALPMARPMGLAGGDMHAVPESAAHLYASGIKRPAEDSIESTDPKRRRLV